MRCGSCCVARPIHVGDMKEHLTEKRAESETSPCVREKILINAARCNLCNTTVESKHRHDFVTCACGNLSVDGGHDYLKRCFRDWDAITELAVTDPPGRTAHER